MNVFLHAVFGVVFCSLLMVPSAALSAVSEKGLGEYYTDNNSAMVVKFLEQQIKQLQDKAAANKSADSSELYRLHLFLAHTYAWKLNKFSDALAEYQKAIDNRLAREQMAMQQMPARQQTIPAYELLFIGGMYEQKKDYQKALEYYQKIVQQVQPGSDNASDNDMAMMGQDFICLVQYQIDGLQLKLQSAKDFKPQLKTLNLLSPANPQFFTFMMSGLLPELQYAGDIAGKTDLQNFIKASPANIHSMILEYIIVSNFSAGSMNPSVQAGLDAFLAKYPDSYFSLSLRNFLVRYYKESGENDKAMRYMKELADIARSRNMVLITEPEKKSPGPQTTGGGLSKEPGCERRI